MVDHRIIGACIVLNGGQFLADTMAGFAKKIKDLNAIHLLDGPWENSGFTELCSTDNTKQIIEDFEKKFDWVEVKFDCYNRVYRNPPQKRNLQLKAIDDEWGEQPYHVFWFDDDEVLQFTTGQQEIWLRDALRNCPQPVVIPTYAHGGESPMNTVRFIPGKQGYHWHTEIAMVMHDISCNVIMDGRNISDLNGVTYCQNRVDVNRKVTFWNNMFIVNRWTLRDSETLDKRGKYSTLEYESWKTAGKCTYNIKRSNAY